MTKIGVSMTLKNSEYYSRLETDSIEFTSSGITIYTKHGSIEIDYEEVDLFRIDVATDKAEITLRGGNE